MSIYKTDNMAVAAYFDINKIKYLGPEEGKGRNGNTIVFFKFEDEKDIAGDLERSFRNSKEKVFRDSLLFFRNEVYKVIEEGRS